MTALWCSDMHAHRVLRIVTDGHAVDSVETVVEVTDDDPSGLGWLPDGRLLLVAMESQQLRRVEADGTVVVHADLSSAARGDLNDMIVAADGTAYVGDMGARIQAGGEMVPGQTFRVAPDGSWSQAADDLRAPNGHVLTEDGRTLIVAESGGSRLTAFVVGDDGTLSDRRTYAELVPAKEGSRSRRPTASAWTPRVRCGSPTRSDAGCSGCGRAARSPTRSTSTTCRSRACSAARAGAR